MKIVTSVAVFLALVLAVYADVSNVQTNMDGTVSGPPMTDLTKAVNDKDSAALLEYIKSGGTLNTEGTVIPLIYAAVRKFEEGVVTMIESGANVDAVEGDGWSTLMFCSHNVSYMT